MSLIPLIDTHCHLYDGDFVQEMEAVVSRARKVGVKAIYLPNIDKTSIDPMMDLGRVYPDLCFPMMGIHPCYVKEDWSVQLDVVRDWLAEHRFSGIGEIGLDFYWDVQYREQQKLAFAKQLEWALEYDLPVSIHSRNATKECIEMVRAIGNGKIKGVFHCFSGSREVAETIIELNMFLGIGGVATFKKSGLDAVVSEMGLSRLVLETDAPYLAPVPFRGKRNEPSFIVHVAEKLSEITGFSIEEVGRITSQNAQDLFGYKNPI